MKKLLERFIEDTLLELDTETIQDAMLDNKVLPFENIFKGKLRIVQPYTPAYMKDIKDELEKLGYEVDIDNSKIYQTKQSQRGVKKNEVKLGKVLDKEYKNLEKKILSILDKNPKALETYQAYQKKFENPISVILSHYEAVLEDPRGKKAVDKFFQETGLNEKIKDLFYDFIKFKNLGEQYSKQGSNFAIVISRAPIDVLRMSDFKNLQSCHSKGGSYWQCAVAEAQDGGAIAFVVNKQDLEGIDLQQDEIFYDPDRGTKGIKPISRIRLRNFSLGNGKNLAVPEKRVYGAKLDIEDELLIWARENQLDEFLDDNGNIDIDKLPEQEQIKLKGGAYTDTTGSSLLNRFFGQQNFYQGHIDFDNTKSSQTTAEQYEEEAQNYEAELGSDLKYVKVSWEIQGDEDNPEIFWEGSIYLEMPELAEDMYWKASKNELKKIIDEVNDEIGQVINLDYYNSIPEHKGAWISGYTFYITVEGENFGHPDDFADFLRYCQDVNGVYERMKEVWDETILSVIKEREELLSSED